jgi:hypothetical protein
MSKENLVSYLYGKRAEVSRLRFRDVLLAKAIADIHRYTVKQSTREVLLWSITPIHCIDRLPALKKLSQRVRLVRQHKRALQRGNSISREKLLEVMPSVSGIKVISDNSGNYISFEGNGRLEALKRVFKQDEQIHLASLPFYRIVNNCDLVTSLPVSLGANEYVHSDDALFFDQHGGVALGISDNDIQQRQAAYFPALKRYLDSQQLMSRIKFLPTRLPDNFADHAIVNYVQRLSSQLGAT